MLNILVRLPLHVSVHMYDHLQGARDQYFVLSPNWIPLMYVCCLFVQYAAICHYRRFVCVRSSCSGEIWSMTRSHLNRSSGHTHKTTVMTYGRILHKQTTNIHQQNPIWWLHKVLIASPLKMVIHMHRNMQGQPH
jgi:hypothetical protein